MELPASGHRGRLQDSPALDPPRRLPPSWPSSKELKVLPYFDIPSSMPLRHPAQQVVGSAERHLAFTPHGPRSDAVIRSTILSTGEDDAFRRGHRFLKRRAGLGGLIYSREEGLMPQRCGVRQQKGVIKATRHRRPQREQRPIGEARPARLWK